MLYYMTRCTSCKMHHLQILSCKCELGCYICKCNGKRLNVTIRAIPNKTFMVFVEVGYIITRSGIVTIVIVII